MKGNLFSSYGDIKTLVIHEEMAFQFVGDNAKWNVHCIMSNQEPEESVISYETPRDYKSINSKLFSSNKDCTDWLCQMQAGPAMV